MTEKNEGRLVSRRDFLGKSALMGAGLAAAGAMAACAPAGAAATQKWDKEVDVLVVGSGTVVTAAIAAKDAGVESVLIIEKGVAFGGTSALSGGGTWIPLNYVAKEQGLEDNRDDVIKYLTRITAGQSTDELIAAYVDNANKMIEWLRDSHGYQYVLGNSMFNDYYQLPGYRPFGRTVYYFNGEATGGRVSWEAFHKTCDELGIEIMMETAGKRLVTNEAGEVIGVIAESNGSEIAIKAKKGVVLGTGGFDFNKEMVAAYLRGPILASNAVPTNTGDGHLMAMAIGADLRNMSESWGLPFVQIDPESMKGEADWQTYRGKPGAVVVNKYGKRIGNEASAYEVFQRAFYDWNTGTFEYSNIPSVWIADSTFAEYYPMPGSNYQVGVIPEIVKQFDTLEDLCAEFGIDFDGLTAELEAFNANALEGVDPVWHRGEYDFDKGTAGDLSGKRTELKNNCLAPVEKGPFFAAPYIPGTCGTSGGLRINPNAQVLNVWGQPIPRLYAVGNTSGSVMGAAYPGGGSTLGAGNVFGMLAGNHAATLEAWDKA